MTTGQAVNVADHRGAAIVGLDRAADCLDEINLGHLIILFVADSPFGSVSRAFCKIRKRNIVRSADARGVDRRRNDRAHPVLPLMGHRFSAQT